MTTAILLGLDVGTSSIKGLTTNADGEEISLASQPTPWGVRTSGRSTEMDPDRLIRAVVSTAGRAVTSAIDRIGPVDVRGMGVTGMAESGVLVNDLDEPAYPIIAWFDPRGQAELESADPEFVCQFPHRTGLPVSALATVAKLRWFRTGGISLHGGQWLNVPEYVVARLGGRRAAERSLASRTGLVDQETRGIWPAALRALDVSESILPPLVAAGTPLGRADATIVPDPLRGTVLTVAGHDHPVAAVGCGAIDTDTLFDSFGTAEAVLRTSRTTFTPDERAALVRSGINVVDHALPGRRVLLGGTKGGLLLGRTLDLLGVETESERDRLDAEASARADELRSQNHVVVTGAANSDGVLDVRVGEGSAGPADVWYSATRHCAAEAMTLINRMDEAVGPASVTVLAGGWSQLESVRRTKTEQSPRVCFSDRSEPGAFGAAIFAAHAAERAESGHDGLDSTEGPSRQLITRFTIAARCQEEPA